MDENDMRLGIWIDGWVMDKWEIDERMGIWEEGWMDGREDD